MQFLFSPIWGRWSDQIGRKPIILLGLLGSCLWYVTLALAGSLTLLFIARIIGGIAGANIPTAQAYIADITTPEDRARKAWDWWAPPSGWASSSVRRSAAS